MRRVLAALCFAVLAVPTFLDDVATFPYKHPELDRTPPTVPETTELSDGESLESTAAAAIARAR